MQRGTNLYNRSAEPDIVKSKHQLTITEIKNLRLDIMIESACLWEVNLTGLVRIHQTQHLVQSLIQRLLLQYTLTAYNLKVNLRVRQKQFF